MTEETKTAVVVDAQEVATHVPEEKAETVAEIAGAVTQEATAEHDVGGAELAVTEQAVDNFAAPRKKLIPNWVWVVMIILFNILIWVLLPKHR
jgi:t-SNARE complex subunit (syntaxin)